MARVIPLFHHLGIMPAWLGAFEGRWTTASLIVRHATVDVYERLPMTAPSIRQHGRRTVTVRLAAFDVLPQFNGGLCFGWPNASPNSQARVGFNCSAPPIFP